MQKINLKIKRIYLNLKVQWARHHSVGERNLIQVVTSDIAYDPSNLLNFEPVGKCYDEARRLYDLKICFYVETDPDYSMGESDFLWQIFMTIKKI